MLLKNKSARLITINGTGKNEKYQIKCGSNPAVEVPDTLCKSAFVKALLKDGSLVPHVELDEDDDEPKSKAELIAECEMLGIETNSRDTVKSLTEKIEAFNQ